MEDGCSRQAGSSVAACLRHALCMLAPIAVCMLSPIAAHAYTNRRACVRQSPCLRAPIAVLACANRRACVRQSPCLRAPIAVLTCANRRACVTSSSFSSRVVCACLLACLRACAGVHVQLRACACSRACVSVYALVVLGRPCLDGAMQAGGVDARDKEGIWQAADGKGGPLRTTYPCVLR
jgi:hypothetical protein